jgi:cytidylate kinase
MPYDSADVRASCPIAIDGPAASGKSTLGRRLAKELGYVFSTPALCTAPTPSEPSARRSSWRCRANEGLANQLDMRVKTALDTHIFLGDEDVTRAYATPRSKPTLAPTASTPVCAR